MFAIRLKTQEASVFVARRGPGEGRNSLGAARSHRSMLLLRPSRLLKRLVRATASDWGCVYWHDDLARPMGGSLWGLPRARRRELEEIGPVFNVLCPVSEIYEHIWDARPGVAFALPDSLLQGSLLYTFIAQPTDCRHVALFGYPMDPDGGQAMVLLARRHGTRAYEPRALRAMEDICRIGVTELPATLGEAPRPRHARPEEHTAALDAQLRPAALSRYMRALLALFYRVPGLEAESGLRLPTSLEHDIRRFREDYLRSVQPVDGGFYHAFTKSHQGRLLCLAVQSHPDGSFQLTLHEDVSQLERLRRIKAACRALERDRASVFSASLIVAEGVQETAEIARRAGLAALKPSSALRIVNRARSIVAEA